MRLAAAAGAQAPKPVHRKVAQIWAAQELERAPSSLIIMAKDSGKGRRGGRQLDAAALARREQADKEAAALVSKDARFAAALNDPRFKRGAGKKQGTVAIDERFAGAVCGARVFVKAATCQ